MYKIIYSKRRTLGITVKGGDVTVRAPYNTPTSYIEEFVYSHKEWIEKHREKQLKKIKSEPKLTDEDILALKKQARIVLTEKTEYFANILNIKYGRITITSAKTRYGSCSSNGNISYSYRLMLCPSEAIDYVVVHELCHRVYMNHSPNFYKLIESVFPDYKKRRQMLI